MSRPIKFRAWDKISKGWANALHASADTLLGFGDLITAGFNQDNRYEFVFWTGLLDKNGEEIWEGDIVKCGDWNMVVEWVHGAFRWKCGDGWTNECASANGNMQIVEVIGNIYENPELLERKMKGNKNGVKRLSVL